MKPILFYPCGSTEACRAAALALEKAGVPVIDHPAPEITHLLLDVPSLAQDGSLRGGGSLPALLRMLPADITVVGGGLNHPALSGYAKLDLLKREDYLARNAALTAECALRTAADRLDTAFADTPAVVIGWGRIGKCLARLLKSLGCPVTVAARKERDLGLLRALGYPAVPVDALDTLAPRTRLLFNTAPEPVLDVERSQWKDCLAIDLASQRGLTGEAVLWARGLPGLLVPRSSGALIAESILREGTL